jgi:hypothetical protein
LIELAVIGVVLAGLGIGILLNPDVIPKLPLLYVLALAPTLVLVTVGLVRKRWRDRAIERRLGRLVALRDGEGEPAAVEAEALYQKLRQSEVRAHLDVSKDFMAATEAAGPHQVWCLRVLLHHAKKWDEPWVGILRNHEHVVRGAPMPQEEKIRLDELLAPPSAVEENSDM